MSIENTISIPAPNSPTGAVTRRYDELITVFGETFALVPEYGSYTVRHYRSGYELVGGFATTLGAKRAALKEIYKLGADGLRRQVENLKTINTEEEIKAC
jgi:hypothetical protein